MTMRLIVTGAAGRMGQMLVRAIHAAEGCQLVAALGRDGSPALGQDAGMVAGLPPLGIAISADIDAAFAGADGVIDFSTPAASVAFAQRAAEAKIAHIIGTTGMSEMDMAAVKEAARHIPIIQSGNMSLGVNLLAALVRKAAATLDPSFDIEIIEMHHRMKVDAPSGTALMLGDAAAAGRGVDLADAAVRGRDGHTGVRREGAIGFASLRGGTVIGDHAVIFAGAGERIELRHIAEDRALFAGGAVRAALWAQGRPAGLYAMADVLGIAQ